MIARAHDLAFLLTPAAILLGSFALATRPPAMPGALLVLAAAGMIGGLAPLRSRPDRNAGTSPPVVVCLGVAAFAAARVISAPLPAPVTALTIGVTVGAGIAEEAFFRRLVYGWLAGAGAPQAIAGSAALFAIVHLPAYGAHVLPLDLAAGLLFAWQRWATGGWAAPALTHAAANVIQLL